MKGCGNFEINDEFLEENLRKNNLFMELAMQIISTDQTVRCKTAQDLEDFNTQSLVTQAKKGEQLVSMTPANKKALI